MSVHALETMRVRIQRMKIRRQFRRNMGYDGNFEDPKTYQEKVQFRKLYGNHEFYAMAADKFRVRRYVAEKAGEQYLIPLLGAYDRLHPAVFESLPDRFIIKANHGCKWHEVVRDKHALDIAATVRRFNALRSKRFGWLYGERHYNFIRPKFVIEELLEGNTGGLPWDYCFFCYHGASGFDYNMAICAPDGRGAAFTKDWQLLMSKIPHDELAPHLRPANFQEMVAVAHDLSADFDFVRVDLYSVGDRVYFGELTCTPSRGYGPVEDEPRRTMRDQMWELDGHNRLLYNPPAAYLAAHPAPQSRRTLPAGQSGEAQAPALSQAHPAHAAPQSP